MTCEVQARLEASWIDGDKIGFSHAPTNLQTSNLRRFFTALRHRKVQHHSLEFQRQQQLTHLRPTSCSLQVFTPTLRPAHLCPSPPALDPVTMGKLTSTIGIPIKLLNEAQVSLCNMRRGIERVKLIRFMIRGMLLR